ncbi:MAG: M48 family metallopeptidase [Comamonas sp.]|nr:M48 family metallopeptidase [Comamonas sp.]
MPSASLFSSSFFLTAAFACALALQLLAQVGLLTRQVRHVARHRSAVPAAFAEKIPLAAHQKAADYTLAKAQVALLQLAWGAVLLLGWTLLGGLDALHQGLLAWMGPGLGQQVVLVAAFALISGLLELPFSAYQTFVVEQRFGFNQSTPGLWLGDLLKSTLLAAVIGLPLVAAVLWLMQAAGSLWWLWAWGLWTGFQLLLMWIFPTFIAPLFNQFQPLEDAALKERVTALMQRCGFAAKGLFVMDGSRRSAHANAYFTGLGNAKRVVFYDTLLKKLDVDEVEAVLAHELGHFKHRHITKRMVVMFAISLGGLALLGWVSQQPWFYTGLGVAPTLDLALGASSAMLAPGDSVPMQGVALLLFMLVVPVFSFWLGPLSAHFSRRDEFQADAYAAAQARPAALASALLKLYEDNAATLTPDPLYARFYYSHPPAVERLGQLHQAGRLESAA